MVSVVERAGRLRAVALSLVLVLAVSAPAAGQTAEAAEQARAYYLEAKELLEQGRVRESLEKLMAAHEAYPSDGILISIANRHLDLGEPEEAAAVLSRITTTDKRLEPQISRLRADVEARLAEPVTVSLAADGPRAKVSIDGGPLRELPARVQLPRGRHSFLFRADGREDVEQSKDLRGSIEIPIVVHMDVAPGQWKVAIEPPEKLERVRVLLDGNVVPMRGEERLRPVSDSRDLPPGRYEVKCLRGYEAIADAVAKLEVRSGETVVATCRFPDADGADDGEISPWAWVTGGLALGSLGAGAGFLGSYFVDLENFPPPRYEVKSTKHIAGGVLLGTGVALGVASAFLFAFGD